MAVQLASAGPVGQDAFEQYADWARRTATGGARTGTLLDLLMIKDDVSDWIEAVAPSGVDDALIVAEIIRRVQGEPKGNRRQSLARNVVALRPTDPPAQQLVVDLIVWLLGRRSQVDTETAARIVPALVAGHRSAKRLGVAFEAAADAGFKLTERQIRDLVDAGVATKRRSGWLERRGRMP